MKRGLVLVRSRAALALALVAALAGCGGPKLGAPETFRWSDQPIAFSKPPAGWRAEGDGGGGTRGVRFVKERSVGEVISVAEYYLVGDRDRRDEPGELLERMDASDDRELSESLTLAHWRTEQPWSPAEAEAAGNVNSALDQAGAALRAGDRSAVRAEIEQAVEMAKTLRITLDDVVDSVAFDPRRHPEPARYKVGARKRLRIGGEPAVSAGYTLRTSERVLQCREVYVMHDNHLYIARLQGLGKNLRLFDQVAASIAFPPRQRIEH